jgi:tryptophan 7-halogenase
MKAADLDSRHAHRNKVRSAMGTEMTKENLQTIAILGGGVAGWLSAATLATMLGKAVSITLIECAIDRPTPATPSCLPPLKALFSMLGLEEAKLLSVTQGTMKLGTEFVNWGALGNRYFHPHGTYGAEFDPVPLHHWWLKARADDGTTPDLRDLSLATALAQEGRFTPPAPDRRLIQATLDYAYQLDPVLLEGHLKQLSLTLGVTVVTADVSEVALKSNDGFVDALTLSNSQKISADFYLDCSGPSRQLISKALNVPFESWAQYLPCDTALQVRCQNGPEFAPSTRITQREAGWQWRATLQHETSIGHVFASQYLAEDDALATLMDNLDGRLIGEPASRQFENGRMKTPFHKNVLAIGDAAGFLEPLESTALHFVQSAVTRLLALWPTRTFEPSLIAAYNDVTATEWERARDFLILHYHATTRTDTPLWRACKDEAIPDSLAERLSHWQTRGRLISPGPETFQSPSWLSVYVGQNVQCGGWDPLADYRAAQVDYQTRLRGLAKVIQETVAAAPHHKQFIDTNCKAERT